MRIAGSILLAALCLARALAQETAVSFTAPPTFTRSGDGGTIAFTASSVTDVEVAIVGAQGKVVRHLVAGLLGKGAPEPLKPDALQQSVAWDGKDDLGQTPSASAGPFTARVRLGMHPKLDSFIGYNASTLGSVRGIACGPTGEVFVFHVMGGLHPGDGTAQCSVFSRDGKYVRTIIPTPANIPAEKLKGVKRIELGDGKSVPFIYNVETRQLLPGTGDMPALGPVVSKDGRVIFPVILDHMQRYPQPGPERIMNLNPDGSVAPEGLLTCALSPNNSRSAFLALSPDEKTIYAAGLTGKKGSADHVVLKFGREDKQPQVFAGKVGEAGNSETLLDDPCDVATDKAGNVYVADLKNDRIAVFAPDGKFLAAMKADKPQRVKVNAATGAVYTLGGVGVNVLQKFTSYKDATPVASATLPTFKNDGYTAFMALDTSAATPALYLGNTHSGYCYSLLRVEDSGKEFAKPVELGKQPGGIGSVMSVEYDRVHEKLISNNRTFDPVKNLFGPAPQSLNGVGYPISVGMDGNFYTQLYGNFLMRLSGEFKPMTFPESKEKNGWMHDGHTSARLRGRGIDADPAGNVFIIWQEDYTSPAMNYVDVYTPSGAMKKEKLIDSDIRSVNSIRLDYRGNVYVALGARPGTEKFPKDFQGKIPDGADDPEACGGLNGYPMLYGSIAKFGPDGGVIKLGSGGEPCNYAFKGKTDVKGAKWIHGGASPVPSWRTAGTPDICLCESPRFDVDGYGRSFFPDAGRFRVGVLDTGGNELAFFGSYGNPDSGGPGSAIPAPEIPFWWIYTVAVADDVVYCGDRLSRRIAVVKLEYAAEKTVGVGK